MGVEKKGVLVCLNLSTVHPTKLSVVFLLGTITSHNIGLRKGNGSHKNMQWTQGHGSREEQGNEKMTHRI